MESFSLHARGADGRQPVPVRSSRGAAPARRRTPTPRPQRARRLALSSDFDEEVALPPLAREELDDFSDLEDTRYADLQRERRARRWFFRIVAVLALAGTFALLTQLMRVHDFRRAVYGWATFGLVQ